MKGWSRLLKVNIQITKPITYSVLKQLKRCLQLERLLFSQDKLMLWSAFTLAYFGFLRVSEYTTQSKEIKCAPLLLSDLTLFPEHLILSIRKDKTNQNGFPVCLKLRATLKSCCPVRACCKYFVLRSNACRKSVCFTFNNGAVLTRQDVNFWLKKFLGCNFSSHSFRIGAATSACLAGWSTDQIRLAGRWKSNAYIEYIQP